MSEEQASGRAERLRKARAAASAELGLPDSDLRCKRYALLTCEHDELSVQYLNGESSVDALLKLETAMQEIKTSLPPEPMTITTKYAETITGICPLCRGRVEDYKPLEPHCTPATPSTPTASADGGVGPTSPPISCLSGGNSGLNHCGHI